MQLESADVEVGSPGWEVVAVESDSAVDDATDAYPWVVALVDAVVGTDICEALTPREKSLVDMPIVGNGGNALAARDESLVDVSVVNAVLCDSGNNTLTDETFGKTFFGHRIKWNSFSFVYIPNIKIRIIEYIIYVKSGVIK